MPPPCWLWYYFSDLLLGAPFFQKYVYVNTKGFTKIMRMIKIFYSFFFGYTWNRNGAIVAALLSNHNNLVIINHSCKCDSYQTGCHLHGITAFCNFIFGSLTVMCTFSQQQERRCIHNKQKCKINFKKWIDWINMFGFFARISFKFTSCYQNPRRTIFYAFICLKKNTGDNTDNHSLFFPAMNTKTLNEKVCDFRVTWIVVI